MSKYTTEVRFICEHYAGLDESTGYEKYTDIIEKSRSKVFDFSYPIFDETYRGVLETKILKHYYTREICCETVGQWKHFLDMRLNEIMPYYNKLYESELIKFNPLYDTDLTRDHTRENNGTRNEKGSFTETDSTEIERTGETLNENNSVTNGSETVSDNDKLNRWETYQDTPQGGLTGVQTENYLTNARHITEDKTGSTRTSIINSTANTTGETNTTENENITATKNGSHLQDESMTDLEDYLEHVRGKSGGVSYSKMLNEYRDTFLNIDAMIIDDLQGLFFNLW